MAEKARLPLYLTQFGFVPVSSQHKPVSVGDYYDGRTVARRYTSHKTRDAPKVEPSDSRLRLLAEKNSHCRDTALLRKHTTKSGR